MQVPVKSRGKFSRPAGLQQSGPTYMCFALLMRKEIVFQLLLDPTRGNQLHFWPYHSSRLDEKYGWKSLAGTSLHPQVSPLVSKPAAARLPIIPGECICSSSPNPVEILYFCFLTLFTQEEQACL